MSVREIKDAAMKHTSGNADPGELLLAGLESMSSATSMKDLAVRCGMFLKGVLETSEVLLALRQKKGDPWNVVVGDKIRLGEVPVKGADTAERSSDGKLLSARQSLNGETEILVAARPGQEGGTFSETHLRLLRHAMRSAAHAGRILQYRQNEKDLVFSHNQRVLQLTSLIDTGIDIAKLDHLSISHRLALERATALTNASKGRVTVAEGSQNIETYVFPQGLPESSFREVKNLIRTGFTFGGRRFEFELADKESRSGIAVFDDTDQLLLDALARQVHASLENQYLLNQSLEKQKIEQDLAVAASIQQRILPAELPAVDGYDAAGVNFPSRSVGGDYYDFIPLADGRYALVVADVAGKGMPAALLVSSLHASLSAFLESNLPLEQLVGRLNRAVCKASTDDKFITAFIGVLDPETGTLQSVNAGHTPGYLLHSDGTVEELSRGGVPLGMLDIDFPYESDQVTLARGERLLLFTDGIPEAQNESGDFFQNAASLKDIFSREVPSDAKSFLQTVVVALRNFTADAPQADDITALYLIRH